MTKPTLASAYTAPRPMPDAMNGSKLRYAANQSTLVAPPPAAFAFPLRDPTGASARCQQTLRRCRCPQWAAANEREGTSLQLLQTARRHMVGSVARKEGIVRESNAASTCSYC